MVGNRIKECTVVCLKVWYQASVAKYAILDKIQLDSFTKYNRFYLFRERIRIKWESQAT